MLNYNKMAEEIMELFETKKQNDSTLTYDYFVKYKYNSWMDENQKEYLLKSISNITNQKGMEIIPTKISQLKTYTIVVYFDTKF